MLLTHTTATVKANTLDAACRPRSHFAGREFRRGTASAAPLSHSSPSSWVRRSPWRPTSSRACP